MPAGSSGGFWKDKEGPMVFSSITFLFAFLAATLLIYYCCPLKGKNWVLALSGLVFYAWGEPVYIVLMIFSTLVDYTAGRIIHRYADRPGIRKAALIASIVIELGLLGVFKYSSFLVGTVNGLLGLSLPDPALPLPIGISFYTFQSMSYTIDLYRGDTRVQKNYIYYLAYVSMFPQLVAGPIVRYEDIARELESRTVDLEKIGQGAFLFAVGLGKKALLANNIGQLWTQVKALSGDHMPAVTAWLGILAFTFQIYFDFSGYSDMACGMGRMLGFTFPQNFRYPYMAKSVSDFWRRWHITLSSWFKSYVYIPLGGNRKGTPRTIRNLLVVWLLTGLWHGASWNFVLWGLYFGVLLIVEKFFLGKYLERLPAWIQRLYAFLLVVLGWVFFELESPAAIGTFLQSLVGAGGFADGYSGYLLLTFGVLLVLCVIASNDWLPRLWTRAEGRWPAAGTLRPVWMAALLAASLAFLVNATYNPFLYFRF